MLFSLNTACNFDNSLSYLLLLFWHGASIYSRHHDCRQVLGLRTMKWTACMCNWVCVFARERKQRRAGRTEERTEERWIGILDFINIYVSVLLRERHSDGYSNHIPKHQHLWGPSLPTIEPPTRKKALRYSYEVCIDERLLET